MKKIAFIGCSHFSATDMTSQGYNNWTYQLYKKFPQHQYRNYSAGGRGIDYFQIAILHAKDWGADIVFVNRTYCGRWQMFAETDPRGVEGFVFRAFNEQPNWQEMELTSQNIYGNTHKTYYVNELDEQKTPTWRQSPYERIAKFFVKNMAGTETRRQYELMWYKNVTKLYNFEHTFLIDWDPNSHRTFDDKTNSYGPRISTSNINENSVVEWFSKRYNATGDKRGRKPLWKFGITISKDDNHLTPKGNLELLEDYILANEGVLKSLID